MRTDTAQPVRLADYRPFPFRLESLALEFDLAPSATRVKARLVVERLSPGPLVLNGERLTLERITLDGRALSPGDYVRDSETLSLDAPEGTFVLETEVVIDPEANTALSGLYLSGGRFCTQCEAEGFRTITFFPDRPDVLTRYTVRIEGPGKWAGRLLSNGNLVEEGVTESGRAFAVWNDPFPKPAYLFALVAGELDQLEDRFVTLSGREVTLRIFVDPGQSARAAYAMDALKRSMTWDEQVYGREYDLDLFMIVAVRDFNFGAMENKGLNIFNSSLLLADEATATDLDFERIESVVAHEYFHNWTGNRITCRDWFQLCLKEGLTVFRDQSFSADQRGAAVQRIKDVRLLRARQFPEDAGPIAHPVRPTSYVKIDNFYTATIYEKGAEVIRMLKTLIGDAAFRSGMDLYFDRHDGEATTVEAFIACFAEKSGKDLTGFFRWYEQAGTPRLTLTSDYFLEKQRLTISLAQTTPATQGQPTKLPVPIPVRLGLLSASGAPLASRLGGIESDEHLLILDKAQAEFVLEGVTERPVLSPLRAFSAPVRLIHDQSAHDLYVRMAADGDLFNRWEAGQILAEALILKRASGREDELGEERFAAALGRALSDESADAAFRALMLSLPSESDLAQAVSGPVDPAALHAARDALRLRISVHLSGQLKRLHHDLQSAGEFSPAAADAGRRALRNAVLDMLCATPDGDAASHALGHFRSALTMTDQMGGLLGLMALGGPNFESALETFYTRWKSEPLVIDKWFQVQARDPSETALGRVLGLTAHPEFDARNPNRLRALVLGFASMNPFRFHAEDGSGYRFLTDQIIAVDRINPNVAARLVEPMSGWARYAKPLADKMRGQLQRLFATEGLSRNVSELVGKALGD